MKKEKLPSRSGIDLRLPVISSRTVSAGGQCRFCGCELEGFRASISFCAWCEYAQVTLEEKNAQVLV